MSKKRHLRNPFTGRWKVISLYCNVHNQGWMLFEIYDPKSFIWEFTEIQKIEFPSGSVAYGGKLTELRQKQEPEKTEYAYYPSDRHLYIDRSDIESDGFVNMCINDRYRVEWINDTDLWLYDLEDIGKEPEEYRFKMKIRRLADVIK